MQAHRLGFQVILKLFDNSFKYKLVLHLLLQIKKEVLCTVEHKIIENI